jgi:triosephosphate isomerase
VSGAGRKPLISGNWKMHLNHFDAIQFVQKLSYLVDKDAMSGIDVSLHPPFTDLRSVQTLLDADRLPYALGAQHCHWEDKGAYTGEVAPPFLAKLGVSYVICGHSERRELFGETDEMVARKAQAILTHGMTPIVCVGETLAEREKGGTEAKVVGQVGAALGGRSAAEVASLVIAYEPIWAIGTGRTATPDDAQAVCATIRAEVASAFGGDVAHSVRIQYGGSVKAANIGDLMAQADIDGALVGGASLDPDEFAQIVRYQSR